MQKHSSLIVTGYFRVGGGGIKHPNQKVETMTLAASIRGNLKLSTLFFFKCCFLYTHFEMTDNSAIEIPLATRIYSLSSISVVLLFTRNNLKKKKNLKKKGGGMSACY